MRSKADENLADKTVFVSVFALHCVSAKMNLLICVRCLGASKGIKVIQTFPEKGPNYIVFLYLCNLFVVICPFEYRHIDCKCCSVFNLSSLCQIFIELDHRNVCRRKD